MYRKAKITTVIMLILSTLVFVTALLYLTLGNSLGIYDWRFGLLAVALIFISISVFSLYFRDFHALFIAPRCPRCDGTLEIAELELQGEIIIEEETLPPIFDKVARCTNCRHQHHHVYAKWSETGPTARQYWGDSVRRIIYESAIILVQRPGLSDKELAELIANWDSDIKQPKPTRAEWEALLERLQRKAQSKNLEAGMIFPKDKK